MNDFKLKYLIADTECLSDYFSFQCKNESNDKIYIYECYNDNDIRELYQLLSVSTRPQYYYSIDYDKVMLNALCKMVEKNYTDIIPKLREINDLIIQQKLNYFRLNRSFWCDYYFKYKENNPELKHQELFKRSANNFIGVERELIDNFPAVLGQSEVIKNMIINSIPKIMYYFSIRKDNSIIPTISLKNLQLINENYNIKFDFNKYKSIKDIKKDGLYDKWIQYSKNDISSLEKIFLGKPKEDIEKRSYAIEAVKKVKPEFLETDKMLYSENNTELITGMLKLPKDKINYDFPLDYTELIKTNYEKFNKFVEFVNDQKEIKKDHDIKTNYSNYYETNFIDDDKQILDEAGNVSTQINSFDIINIKNDINDIDMKIGFGGAHGAIPEYVGENLLHYDYDGYYPSIILQYKHLFKNIIDVDLYEAIYHMRNDSKPELEKLENEFDDLKKSIKDEKDLRNLLIGPKEKQIEELNKIVIGEKLILNSAFGLINSNYNIPIAFKPLGRFICLKGQGEILNLIDKLKDKHKIVNINTDGLIVER